MLIVDAEISPAQRADVLIDGERISAIAPQLPRLTGEQVIDARGGALIPGLHDHHIHLLALAAAMQSLDCNCDRHTLAKRVSERRQQNPKEIRGIGYHPDDNAGIDRLWLDAICPDIPVRIQHQSGRLWILNSSAINRIALSDGDFPDGAERDESGELTGRFYHLDDWLGEQLPRYTPDLSAVSNRLAACGVTGITDAGPNNNDDTARLLINAQARGELLQDVLLMGREELAEFDTPHLKRGAHKVYLKESNLPEYDALCATIQRCHRKNRPLAFHCVTRVELQFALSALRDAGCHAGDRIEHASVSSDEALQQMVELGITVVTQPHFIYERGDRYLRHVEAEDQPLLYRGKAFLAAAIPFAAGTDAPYGGYDPWKSMQAAIARVSQAGKQFSPEESLAPEQALTLYLGDSLDPGRRQRKLEAGARADLCLLDTDWQTMLAELSSEHVATVMKAGKTIYQR